MSFRKKLYVSVAFLTAFSAANGAMAATGRLSPQNFNKMYYLASQGKIGILREAVNRGLNIDSTNPNGDTGLCIAIKRKDYVAYNSFRMSGANPRHSCTYKIYNEYQEFLENRKAANTDKIVGNEESLYYEDTEGGWWPWILGGAALIGVGAWAMSDHSGSKTLYPPLPQKDKTIIPDNPQLGLSALVSATNTVSSGESSNTVKRNAGNSRAASVVDKIELLPNAIDNKEYMQTFAKATKGARYNNKAGGELIMGDAAIAIAAHDKNSKGLNNGKITINARNGAIGMAASNGATVENNPSQTSDGTNGVINITFNGNKEGDTVIGMYADTHAKAVNYGKITGRTTQTPADSSTGPGIIGGLVEDTEDNTISSPNSGTLVGMAVFDYFTGDDLSNNTVTAENRGIIDLSAGYNGSNSVAVNLVGMGSYIDDHFLDGTKDPAYAENMVLNNYGDIKLAYQNQFNISADALKLGNGGLVGMRADAQTKATNAGNITIDLTSASVNSQVDTAAGMLSVHGGELTNEKNGTISIIQSASSKGGVTYGMLAAKGSGTQTRVYDWKDPKLVNKGLIDMRTSNSYGMASFAGGDIINEGIINLGYTESGNAYYSNNYGIYATGDENTTQANLVNKGTINIHSKDSYAIYNDYTGSVVLENEGNINIENRAVGSTVFGGNFSTAKNKGNINYKVGNSENFSFPTTKTSDIAYNVTNPPIASVVKIGTEDSTSHQYFVNEKGANITVGGKYDYNNTEYGGTYGTAAIQVSNQATADNKGTILLEHFDHPKGQLNTAMWLDETATSEANIFNFGDIIIKANNSIGMRNDSQKSGIATNYGDIYVNGAYSYGMAATAKDAILNNGREESSPDTASNSIHVNGTGSIGIYLKDGEAHNYGDINLNGDHTTAFQLDGSEAEIVKEGNINYARGKEDITFFWMTNGANKTFSNNDYNIDGYTLGKATNGGSASLSEGSATVTGNNSHLFVAEGANSIITNEGSVTAANGATAMVVKGGATAVHNGADAEIIVSDDNSVGIQGIGNGTLISTTSDSTLTVKAGTGIKADNLASVETAGDINVSKGTGISLISSGGNDTQYTEGTNSGYITVTGGTGVSINGAHFTNAQDGLINVASNSAYGIYNPRGYAKNDGTISVSAGTGVKGTLSENTGDIIVRGNGIGVDGTILNADHGTVTVSGNGIGIRGTGINNGNIINNGGQAGVWVTGGTFTNNGKISEINSSDAVVINNGTFINSTEGNIEVSNGTGIRANGGYAENNGKITVGSGIGMYIDSSASGINKGLISVDGGTGVYVNGGTFLNSGTISLGENGGTCISGTSSTGICQSTETIALNGLPLYVADNSRFINTGLVDLSGIDVDFEELSDGSGAYIIGKGGTYKADSFKGNIIASKDIVMGGFKDVYTNQNSFEGKNEGLQVSSESYLFNASVNEKKDTNDIELTRKDFRTVIADRETAQFLETNYNLQNNERLYNTLKSATSAQELDYITNIETGKNFYANLPRENMAVLRGLQGQEQSRILEDGIQSSIGVDYFSLGKDEHSGLSSFGDDVYSPYISYGKSLNNNWSIGGTLRAAYAESTYDEAHSSRNNKVLMAFMPILYQNGDFKFLTTPEFGAGFGSYKRRAISDTYKADTSDFYYGLYNHAEYSIDMKIAELVTEAELNLQGASMGQAKESQGLNLHSNDSISLEAGIGVKLRKRIQLEKERALMLAIGAKYYHEFLDPYKDLRVGMNGSPIDFGILGYNEKKNRLKTTAEAVYTDGNVSVAAEISHNAEAENNIEGGLGMRYNF